MKCKLSLEAMMDESIFETIKGELRQSYLPQVADEAEVNISTLYKWVEDKTRFPRFATICRVAKALGFEVSLIRNHYIGRQTVVRMDGKRIRGVH